MSEFRPEEGIFNLGDVRIAVIAARWNAEITDGLLAGALQSGDTVACGACGAVIPRSRQAQHVQFWCSAADGGGGGGGGGGPDLDSDED